ncbi:MATE family efflux transporter [Paenibacillus sp. TRM 82003]|nr:MATE family efflux transporter [Paenibacillus sp. TRM 82003]
MITQNREAQRKFTLFALTWPIFIELSLHMLMGNLDTFMLSQYDDNAVAAVGVTNQITNMVNLMFGFVATGTTILVSRYLGGRQIERVSQVASTSLTLNLLFGAALSVVLVLNGELFLRMMGLQPELMAYATDYLSITGGFMFLQALLLTASAVIKSHGLTRNVMLITVGMNLVNIAGNYIAIYGPFGLPITGVTGVAYSTVVSRAAGLVIMVYAMLRVLDERIEWKAWLRLRAEHVKDLLRIGVPSAGEQLSHNASQLVITSFIAMIGVTAMVTRVYTFNIIFLITIFSVAIGQSTQILVARAVGAGTPEEAYERCLKSLRIGIVISLAMAGVYNVLGGLILDLFTDDPAVIELGRTLLLLAFLLEPGRAFNLIVISSLRAAGDVKYPVYVGILIMWGLAVPAAYFFGIHLGFGLIGIFVAFIADEWVRGLIMLARWRSRRWLKDAAKAAPPKASNVSA